MSKINVSVTDGTNVNLTVSPRPVQTITVSRGSTGGGGGSGTVTQVTANIPLSVTNGTTIPDLSIAQATTSTGGYLSSTDWNTFNNKVGSITSTDGSITVTGTTTSDLSVASSPNVVVQVRNNTGATLTKGTAVYINGAIGQLPTVTKAQANTDAASAQTLGLMTTDLANNSNGYVTIIGLITNINTSAYTDGQQLYLSPTVAGGLTATKPVAPQHLVYVAVVEHAHITQGKLFVKVQNGYELDELHDVLITSPTDKQLLTYEASSGLWKNKGLESPPPIGSTTPNTITGSTVLAKNRIVAQNDISGGYTAVLEVDNDGYAYIGGAFSPIDPIAFSITAPGGFVFGVPATGYFVTLNYDPTMATAYNFVLPPTAGSANQVLKTNGGGTTDWMTIGSVPITYTGTTDPAAPTGTNTTVYSKSFGGYATLAARNALNTSFGLQSALWSKNFQIWTTTAAINGLWLNATGTGNGNYTNTNPTAGATVYQSCRRSVYANLITTTNQLLGVANGQGCWFRGSTAGLGGYFYYARVGFDVWTNGGRFFAGMAVGTTVITAGDPSTSNNSVGFCVDAADNGAISFLTRGTTAATKASTGLTITSNKGYDCYIYCSPNSSQYSWQIIDINTGTSASGTATANLPSNTIMLASEALASNAALTTADAIKIGVCKIYIESDN